MAEEKNRKKLPSADGSYLRLVIATLVIGGSAAIALIYGPASLVTAVPILLAGAGLILIPWFVLTALANWRTRMEREERAKLSDTGKGHRG